MAEEKKFSWVTDEDIALSNRKLEDARKNFEAGKYNNALAFCRTALRFNPNNAKEIKMLMGKICLETGERSSHWDFNDSIAASDCFDEVIELDPNCAEAYLYSGIAIVHWGNNYKMAIKKFDKALELEPDNKLAAQYRAVCEKCLDNPHKDESLDWDKLERLNDENYDLAVDYLTEYLTKKYGETQKVFEEMLKSAGIKCRLNLIANNLSVYLECLRG